jgi:hypothetical protein
MATSIQPTSIHLTQDVIDKRLDRISRYFPDEKLRSVISAGVCGKDVKQISNADVHSGLEEAVWSFHLVRYITDESIGEESKTKMLSSYISSINGLVSKPKKFFTWGVDHNNPPIWVRLVDRLEHDASVSKVSGGLKSQIDGVYSMYAQAIEARRSEYEGKMKDFNCIFPESTCGELRPRILREETGKLSPKKCGKLLLEIADVETKTKLLSTYFDSLKEHHELALAKKLIKWFEKHLKGYSDQFQGELLPEVRELCEKNIKEFHALNAK